jgi:hypothetical protein
MSVSLKYRRILGHSTRNLKCIDAGVHFSSARSPTSFSINMNAPNPREEARDLFANVAEVLNGKKNLNWVFNPTVSFTLVLSVLGLFGALICFTLGVSHLLRNQPVTLLTGAIACLCVFTLLPYTLMSRLIPYTGFVTQSYEQNRERNKKVFWWILGIAGAIFASVVVRHRLHSRQYAVKLSFLDLSSPKSRPFFSTWHAWQRFRMPSGFPLPALRARFFASYRFTACLFDSLMKVLTPDE